MKSNIAGILTSVGLTIIAVLISVFVILPSSKNNKKIADTLGVWLWDENIDEKYLSFAYNNNIDEIYYSVSSFSETNSKFIEKANEKDIKVYLLCGNHEWIEDDSGLEEIILKYKNFNENYPDNKFSGIHLDVEPHQYEDFEDNKEYYILKFVEFVHHTVTTYSDITFDFDIPAWLDMVISYDEKTQEAFKFIFDYSNRVFVMSYRDSAVKIRDFAIEELDYAKQTNKPIFLCVETGSEENNVTFENEGRTYMYSELRMLNSLISQEFGISIHHLKSWYDLKD